jgi:hypothetical protein
MQPRRVDQALILAVARARSWMRKLRQGEFVDTSEIAQRFRLSNATPSDAISAAQSLQQDYRRNDWTSAATRASLLMTLGS